MLMLACLFVFGAGLLPVAVGFLLLPTPPDSMATNRDAAIAILGLLSFGVLWWGGTDILRGLRNRRAVRGLPESLTRGIQDERDPQLSWKPNHATPSRRRLTLGAAAALSVLAGFGLVSSAAAYPDQLPMGSAIGLLGVLGALGASLFFVAVLPYAVPSAVAITPEGIHLWYDSPYDRRSQTDLMKWTTLDRLAAAGPNAGDPAFRFVHLLRIDSENAMDVYTAWQEHKTQGPA